MTDETGQKDFNRDKHRMPYLEWFDAPAKEVRTGGCMILVSGGSYNKCCDVNYIKQWRERFTELGFQCVNFVYRTPRPKGLPIYQSAWEDGQRAVRMVRSEAKKRGFDPVTGISLLSNTTMTVTAGLNSYIKKQTLCTTLLRSANG